MSAMPTPTPGAGGAFAADELAPAGVQAGVDAHTGLSVAFGTFAQTLVSGFGVVPAAASTPGGRLGAGLRLAWHPAAAGGLEPVDAVAREQGELDVAAGEEGPREIDRLAELLLVKVEALDQAVQNYLTVVDELGEVLSDLLSSDGAGPWLTGAAVLVGGLAARRVARSGRDERSLYAGVNGSSASWYLDLTSNQV